MQAVKGFLPQNFKHFYQKSNTVVLVVDSFVLGLTRGHSRSTESKAQAFQEF